MIVKQISKNFPENKGKVCILGLIGIIGFGVIQLVFIAQSFSQMPKNVAKYFKCPYFKEAIKLLIWEENNKMENYIDDFLENIPIGNEDSYEMVDVPEKRM